jgi:hypothetical protein
VPALKPDELAAFGRVEIAKWSELVKRSGAQVDCFLPAEKTPGDQGHDDFPPPHPFRQPAPPPVRCSPGPVLAQSGPPVRIGSTLALTGPLSATALTHKLVGEIYVEQLNKRGGLLGRKVEWIVKDDQSKPELRAHAVRAADHLDKVDLLMGPYATGAILSAMGVAQRYNKVLVHHTFGIPSLAKYDMQFPAWSLGPDPQNTVSELAVRHAGAVAQAAQDHRHRHQQVPVDPLHVAGRPRGGQEARPEGSAVPRMGLRQPRLRPDRRAREGCQARPAVDRRHRPGRQHAAGGDEEDRLHAAAALPPVPGAGAR